MPKMKAIIVDLDGTLCDIDHRLHYLEPGHKDWPSFFEAAPQDTPNQWCLDIVLGMQAMGYKIIFLTARPQRYWKDTSEWLSQHIPFWSESLLFMMPDHLHDYDYVYKKGTYENVISRDYDVVMCIDDRKQVVDMWRSLGLTCLQCAEGNF